MTSTGIGIEVRSLRLEDLDAIFTIDHQIRKTGSAITYANITTEHVFTVDRHVGRLARPIGYADLIKGDVSELLQLGMVAEIEDHVRGFILGRVTHVGEHATEVGVIIILGVHPDYQRRKIASGLVNAMYDRFRSKGINKMRIAVDSRDKALANFVEHMGFSVGHVIEYTKAIPRAPGP
jgi:ribosomal protein S18 acetylase RimI-like enzyme